MDWKLYYGDGSTFSSDQGWTGAHAAPAWGVQCIVQADEQVGRHLVTNGDYYVYRDGSWLGLDLIGLIDYLTDLGIVKVGRFLPRQAYQDILSKALHDPDFPAKSARLPSERLPA